ncbi:glutaredoxin electron transport component of NrdEF [Mycobacteroides abscessus subsp. massiliense]|uniref:glutaredoxin domain-containing protein n=1 Tax=Mycobacteroides abscessus TaxID=36809 RepID=UPI0009A8729D|nr:glutaredoxin domain-containing protein [Mycobacteroides abscessus]MDO3055618.1 glutaredoxin domain-containing protein [Mycobacteroides abscessus subsp. massiliense]SLC37771.1 glutaredoxin electron transport component of NrdEF [Mycobacteroides abscessus subsp. massiliense]SLH10545.1 glutaredoxin electron transport component of NrdEF [Mycobacteroides abscessus subsp. massiliense]SLI03369.1 glutaredoxin electron transport component of NrdEF [Mycobacteroides abscessus subsp. massiliense]
MVTLYTKPACPQCQFTKRKLDELAVPYQVFDISTDPWARGFAQALGYRSAPVVVVSNDVHWSGFRPDKLNGLAERSAA